MLTMNGHYLQDFRTGSWVFLAITGHFSRPRTLRLMSTIADQFQHCSILVLGRTTPMLYEVCEGYSVSANN
jgi:hypothetical protein